MKSNTPDVRQAAERSARKHILAGVAVIALVLGGTGVWAARTDISGAVVSSGMVVVESKVKKVQHPTGGVVAEIKVKNGSIVKAGDLLVRLDDTVSRANLQLITKQLDELVMREARLEAERDGASSITLPESYRGREDDPDIAKRIVGETSFFKSRKGDTDAEHVREVVRQVVIIGERSNNVALVKAYAVNRCSDAGDRTDEADRIVDH